MKTVTARGEKEKLCPDHILKAGLLPGLSAHTSQAKARGPPSPASWRRAQWRGQPRPHLLPGPVLPGLCFSNNKKKQGPGISMWAQNLRLGLEGVAVQGALHSASGSSPNPEGEMHFG